MWIKIIFGIAFIIIIIGGALIHGFLRCRKVTCPQLDASSVAPRIPTNSEAELAGLPDHVKRYSRVVLGDGRPVVTRVRLTQEGNF